jgi:hypothetical protein
VLVGLWAKAIPLAPKWLPAWSYCVHSVVLQYLPLRRRVFRKDLSILPCLSALPEGKVPPAALLQSWSAYLAPILPQPEIHSTSTASPRTAWSALVTNEDIGIPFRRRPKHSIKLSCTVARQYPIFSHSQPPSSTGCADSTALSLDRIGSIPYAGCKSHFPNLHTTHQAHWAAAAITACTVVQEPPLLPCD